MLQKRILGEISARGNVTADALASKLQVRPHVVRYQLARLLERELLQRSLFIDQRMLGFQTLCFLFDLPPGTQEAAVTFLKSRPEVIWFAHNSGAKEFELSLCVRSTAQAMDLLLELTEKTGAYLQEPVTACEEDLIWWGVRAFSDSPSLSKPVVLNRRERFDDDELERRILRACRMSLKATVREIAQDVGAAESTVTFRLKKLQAAGVISEEICFVLHTAPDMAQVQLYISFAGRSKKLHEQLVRFCQASRFVSALMSYVGDWQYKLVLCGETIGGLAEFEDDLRVTFAQSFASRLMCVRRKMLASNAGF